MKELLLLILFLPFCATAQEPVLYFEKITEQNGLSNKKVNCILQDKRGFIWIGTDDGLNRYDGKNFVHYRNKPADQTSVSGNIITDILEDKEGNLWIASADGGITRYDYRLPPQQQFKQFKHSPSNAASIPVNAVNTLLEDAYGFLWLGTSGKSVLRFNKKTGVFEEITNSSKTILDLCMDKDGVIWVGRQGSGIMKINSKTLSISEDARYKNLYAKLPHVTVTALFKDKDDAMWFGSWDKLLYKQTKNNGEKKTFSKNGGFSFQNDEVLCFAEDNLGRIWLGGKEKGLHIYDKASKRFYNYMYNSSKEGTVSDNRINCLFIDKQGIVWIGTNRGISISNPHKQQFVQHFFKKETKEEITVYDFFEDEENNIWLGTSDGIFIKRKDGTISHRILSYKNNPLHVTAFFKDGDNLYLGTNYSLFLYNPVHNSLSLLPNTEKDGVMNRIIESRVVSIIKDTIEGRPVLLVSPYGHFLTYYDLQIKRWVSRLDSLNILKLFNLKDNLVNKLYKTNNGSVFLATAKRGLGIWEKDFFPKVKYLSHDPSNPHSISNNNVFELVEDNKGNLWVSTYGGGLHYFDVKEKKFTNISATNNLVEGLQVDQRQNVWMISNGHLYKYDHDREINSSYHLPDLEKTGGVTGKIFKDSRGKMYLAGKNYFISFHPDSVAEVKESPGIYLTDFQIFNSSYSHLLGQNEIELSHKENYFAFEFSAPDFSSGSSVKYSYMLEGFDKDWIDAGERNYVSYSNLDGGQYIFKVRATNTPGAWNEDYASMKIIVVPPYWKRPWFYIVCGLLLLLATYSIYRYRINEILKRQSIRNKIAQDLHDNVGSTLSSISVYSAVAKIYRKQNKENELDNTLEKISSASSEMISELNDTVWAINPRNDNMLVIFQRMDSFAKPLLASKKIDFHFTHPNEVAIVNLGMEKRKNFFLIFKEAVNNAVKYSSCSNLWVDVKQKNGHIIMTIQDDGIGFDLAKTSEGYKSSDVFGGGNGLKNMQLRAKEMKGFLNISSKMGEGTLVKLSFPIT